MSNLHLPWVRGIALILTGLIILCGALLLFPHSPDLYLWLSLTSGLLLVTYGTALVTTQHDEHGKKPSSVCS